MIRLFSSQAWSSKSVAIVGKVGPPYAGYIRRLPASRDEYVAAACPA